MSPPLLTYRLKAAPQTGIILRAALFGGAALIALVGILLPRFAPVDPQVGYILLGVALMDVGLAFVLPGIILSQSGSRASFFNDRLEISNGKLPPYQLFYENITSVEEATPGGDDNAGLTDVLLMTAKPARIPLHANATRVLLGGLPAADDPYGQIKELVEKSRAP